MSRTPIAPSVFRVCPSCHCALPTEHFLKGVLGIPVGKCRSCRRAYMADWKVRHNDDAQPIKGRLPVAAWTSCYHCGVARQCSRLMPLSKGLYVCPECYGQHITKQRAAYSMQHRKRHPDRAKARSSVMRAVMRGDIQREPCEVCGWIDSESHHDDYSKPLEVMWLCQKHHVEEHLRIRNLAISQTPGATGGG